MSLLEIYDLVLKDGLRFYKYKNSQLRSISSKTVGDVGKFGVDVAKKTPGAVRSGTRRLADGIAKTGGGIQGMIDSAKEQGISKTVQGGLKNGYNFASGKVKDAASGVKGYALDQVDHLRDKKNEGYDATKRAFDGSSSSDPTSFEEAGGGVGSPGIDQSSDPSLTSEEPHPVGGVSDPTVDQVNDPSLASPSPKGEDGVSPSGGISDPVKDTPIEARHPELGAFDASGPKESHKSEKRGLGKSTSQPAPRPSLGKTLYHTQRMNQTLHQASQRMASSQSHVRGAEIEEEE